MYSASSADMACLCRRMLPMMACLPDRNMNMVWVRDVCWRYVMRSSNDYVACLFPWHVLCVFVIIVLHTMALDLMIRWDNMHINPMQCLHAVFHNYTVEMLLVSVDVELSKYFLMTMPTCRVPCHVVGLFNCLFEWTIVHSCVNDKRKFRRLRGDSLWSHKSHASVLYECTKVFFRFRLRFRIENVRIIQWGLDYDHK